ncbi:MAG: hypothetical protein RIT43_444 [Bacteroidota bacterium]|jgi:uncharacterized membrane protein YphA (DoxX/SURF4 family)
MKEIKTVKGRSLFFNVLFVCLNVLSLVFFLGAFLPKMKNHFWLVASLSTFIFLLTIAGVIIFRGKLLFSNVARVITGSVFIVSGLVKANDPVGFSYKLEEYFHDGALAYRFKAWMDSPSFSLESWIPYALWFAVAICTLEIVIGVFLLIGGKIKSTVWFAAGLMIFFTFLTWHSASCNPKSWYTDQNTYEKGTETAKRKIREERENDLLEIVKNTPDVVVINEKKHPVCVTDCGCFGDAFGGSIGRTLTPQESFLKDLFLLYLVVWIFLSQRIIQPNKARQNIRFILWGLGITALFSIVFNWFFPILFFLLVIVSALWMLRVGGAFFSNYWGSMIAVSLVCLIFICYVFYFDPVKDFRPYAVGKNLSWQMNNGRSGTYENVMVLRNKQTNQLESYNEKIYSQRRDLWNQNAYAFDHMEQQVLVPALPPTISEQFDPSRAISKLSSDERALDFVQARLSSGSNGELISIRRDIVKEKRLVVITSFDLASANWKNIDKIESLIEFCRGIKIPVLLLTSSSEFQIQKFKATYGLHVPVFVNDATELKTISRSNPSLMYLEKGVVRAKFTRIQLPSVERFQRETGI